MKSLRRAAIDEIDWPQVHARLARSAAVMREALQPSAEQSAILLEARARRLARPLAASRSAETLLDLLTFTLSGERYSIETCHVQEVIRLTDLTPVPGVPDVIAGLANLRGQILVVADIRLLFGLAAKDATSAARIVVCGDGQPDLGVLVDCANDVVRLPADDLIADAPGDDRGSGGLVRGVTHDAMIVLDGGKLLADQRLFVDQSQQQ